MKNSKSQRRSGGDMHAGQNQVDKYNVGKAYSPDQPTLGRTLQRDPHVDSPIEMNVTSRLFLGLITLMPVLLFSMSMLYEKFFILAYAGWLHLFILVGLYGTYVLKNRRLNGSMRGVWLVSFVLLGPISLPFYWYLYVWQKPQLSTL